MSSQITVRLPADLSRALKAVARKSQRRSSEIVRMALRAYLEPAPVDRRTAYERVRHLVGAFESGIPDLAEKHSEYVIESLRRGR
jgi:metal-responsive CopG/Arc/MetJ family transcriptional regulator